jgi:Tfp pilus assembly protein PilF
VDRITKLSAFLAAQPEDSFLKHALALEYIKLGDDTAARALFEAILQRQPDYVGSYYHLGKLLERQGEADAAATVYETGMAECKKVKENHAYNELQGAWEDLTDF